ncbi:hypothetical protein HN51_054745 [Arachis hypogaea]
MFVSSSLQYFNQILTVVLEVLDDSDSSIRELTLSILVEMLKTQHCDVLVCLLVNSSPNFSKFRLVFRLNGPRVLYSVRMHCISCSLLVVDGLRHLVSVAMAKIISKGDGISVYARASSL